MLFETSRRGRPARAVLRAVVTGAACLAVMTPLTEVTASVPIPALAGAVPDPAQIVGAEPPDIAARVALGPEGRDIRLAGDLTEGVAARVATLLAANPHVVRIHLTSDGGLVEEAEAIGALVAARGLSTYVPDVCVSACTLVFVRGRARYLAAGGQLGFHAPYDVDPGGRISAVDPSAERAAYLAAGVAADFVARALAVAPDDIWIPEASRLLDAGIVTEVVGSSRFPDSTLDADPSPEAARAKILRNLPALEVEDPATVAALASWYLDGYRTGRTEADALEGLRQRASAGLRRLVRAADDAVVQTVGQVVLTQGTKADACAALGTGDLLGLDEAFRRTHPGGAGLAGLLAPSVVTAAASDEGRADIAAIPDRPVDPRCEMRIEAVRRALDRPPPAAAQALRAMLLGDPMATVASVSWPRGGCAR